MKLKCINQGNFKSIIIDGEYHAQLNNDGTRYQIQIAGVERKYALKYFEVIEGPIPEIIEDVEEVGVVEDEIEVYFDDDNENIEIKINDNSTSLVFWEVASNCGVRSYNGVNFLFENCDQNIDLFRKVMNQVLDLIIEEGRCCMVLFSTNDEYEDIWTVLDEIMDTGSQIVENPNSELDVKLWIKYTN